MDPEFWLERWRRGETGWHQNEINGHLCEFWPRMGLAPGTRVLVPLCGKTLDLLWLAGRGDPVLGVELSRLAVEAFFEDNRLAPELSDEPPFVRYRVDELEVLCGDFFGLTAAHLTAVGAVYDRASLIALPPGQRARYAVHLDEILPSAVPRLLITLEYDQGSMSGPPFSVAPAEVDALFGGRHRVTALAGFDALDESPRFRARGLTQLVERVYRLDPAG